MSKGPNKPNPSENTRDWSQILRAPVLFAGVLVLATGIRLLAWQQSSHSPFYESPVSDSAVYVKLAQEGGGENAFFYADPFYPGFLKMTLVKTGMSWWMPRLLQALLGVATCALVFAIGRALFGVWEGLAGALLSALYGPLIFYETHLLPTTWIVFLTAASLASFLTGIGRKNAPFWSVLGGFLLGWAVIGHPTLCLFLPATLLWWIWMRSDSFRDAVRGRLSRACLLECALLLTGFLLPCGWNVIRNYRLSGQFMPFPVGLGVSFRAGNNPVAFDELSCIFSLPPEERQAAEGYRDAKFYTEMKGKRQNLSPREVSAFWWQKGFSQWKMKPGRAFLLFGKKTLFSLTGAEIPYIQDMDFEKRFMSLFRFPLPSMNCIFPLSVVGLVWRVRGKKDLLPLLLVVSQCLMLGFFFVNARQRMPLVVGLLPLAGVSLASIPGLVRKGRWNGLIGGLLAGVGGLLVTTAYEPPDAGRRLDFMGNLSASACMQKGEYDLAVELFQEILDREENPNPMTLNNAAYAMAERYDKTGQGDLSEALNLARRAFKASRGSPLTADTLIWLLLLDYQTDEATLILAAMMKRYPGYGQFYLRWAYLQMLLCDFEAARNTIKDFLKDASPELKEEGRLLLEEMVEREKVMGNSPTGGEE